MVKAEDVSISALDGSTYALEQNGTDIRSESTLEIRGTTLVLRSRITWATPEIAQSMASGTNGFAQRPVGTWSDPEQMQIVGREAQYHNESPSGSTRRDSTFTISEDGNSIEEKGESTVRGYGTQGYQNLYPRVSGPTIVKSPGEHAYAANCGPTVPNRMAPITTDLCPGNLVAMTYFCGGDTGCPYVCCPKGLLYLNHCDCKCYATSDFECHSYSKAQEQPRQ